MAPKLIEDKSEEERGPAIKAAPTDNTKEEKIDLSKLFEGAKGMMPGMFEMLKPKHKDPSTMCEFTIKGSEDFVLGALSLILEKE